MRRVITHALMTLATFPALCHAQELRIPASLTAGVETSISTSGSGKGTFYLLGPGEAKKSEINLGGEIALTSQELRNAGNYVAIVCSDSCQSNSFWVAPATPASITFLVHPSRVPVALGDAVSGVAIPFDKFRNLVLAPQTINFQLSAGNSTLMTRAIRTQDGIAWFRTNSGRQAGLLSVLASADGLSTRRAVQQVASEPCDLRVTAQQTPKGITVATEPVRDCSGNPVPDGTIVTFTASGPSGKTTVDAPIKQDVARAQFVARGPSVISAASGVVMGNEVRLGGGGQ
ncbi:MAG TPA: hypothetical protein VI386_29395 [Candidatus Sulfotelmatobacter sp.]